MLAFLITLIIISLYKVRFSRFHENYLAQSQTTAIKGIFAFLIILSHMNGYIQMTSPMDILYRKLIGLVGQLMVTMFFFYSGYGVLDSFRRKPGYLEGFFRKRFLKVLVHFDLAVLLFAILNLVLEISYPASAYITCWVGWGSIGNSNWFVFDTLVFYLLTLLAMYLKKILNLKEITFCTAATLLCVAFWVVLKQIRGSAESWWYNTIFCYPAGMWYAVFKERIDTIARKTWTWWICLASLFCLFAALYVQGEEPYYSFCAVVFSVVVVWVTMKIRFQNNILLWLGKNSFSIYILQRIPMIILSHMGLNKYHMFFALLSVAILFPMAAVFSWMLDRIDACLFNRDKGLLKIGGN